MARSGNVTFILLQSDNEYRRFFIEAFAGTPRAVKEDSSWRPRRAEILFHLSTRLGRRATAEAWNMIHEIKHHSIRQLMKVLVPQRAFLTSSLRAFSHWPALEFARRLRSGMRGWHQIQHARPGERFFRAKSVASEMRSLIHAPHHRSLGM